MTALNRRVPTILVGLAVALIAAFVAAPAVLAGGYGGPEDEPGLVQAARLGFVEYWRSGVPGMSPRMQSLVDYWSRFHVAKAAICVILLVVLVTLAAMVWRAFLGADGVVRRIAFAASGVGLMTIGLASLVALMANVQGALAPLSSVLTFLPISTPDPQLAETLGQVRQGMAQPGAAPRAPALHVMVDDFAAYHVVVAVFATLVAVGFIVAGVVAGRRARRTAPSARRTRWLLGSFAVASVIPALAFGAVAVANTGVAAHPAPALLAFFNGGW